MIVSAFFASIFNREKFILDFSCIIESLIV